MPNQEQLYDLADRLTELATDLKAEGQELLDDAGVLFEASAVLIGRAENLR